MYISDIKALIKFDSDIIDSVGGGLFTPIGEDIEISSTSYGYLMKQNQFLSGTVDLEMIDSLTISFWLYPVNPGVAINPETEENKSIQMPLINLARSSSSSDNFLILYEMTNLDGTNLMMIKIFDELSGSFYEASFGDYEANINHHFWITLNTREKNIRAYIDGTEKTVNNLSGSIPDFEDEIDSVDVYINKNHEDDYSYYITNNYGIIDDIAIFNKEMLQPYFIQKVINYGIDDAVLISNQNNGEYLYGFLFDDPNIIKINSMIDDMSYIFIARSDGKILRGSPLFWESRKVFSEDREFDLLNDTVIIEGQNAQIDNGFLTISGSMVRF